MPILSHKIRLTPTPAQRDALTRASGCSRFAWNWALTRYSELKKAGVAKVSTNDLKKEFNSLKAASFPWIYESPKDCNQHPFANLKKALTRFYDAKKKGGRKVGYPKLKKKRDRASFYLSNDKFWVEGKVAKLPVIGTVAMTESLRFVGKIISGTVSRTANDWFLSIQVSLPDEYKRREYDSINTVGVDLGLKTFAVTSDGLEAIAPKPLKANLKRLKRLSRKHSRKQKGSNNKKKSAMQLAKTHQKIASIRLDFTHKLTSKLLRENQTVVIEDLSMAGMLKLWGRAVSDVGFYEFRRQMEYKAPLYRRTLIIADRYFPSSKMCNECGHIKSDLTLKDRDYICESCGVVTDRDLNAARNLADYGRQILKNKLGTASAEVTPVEIPALAAS